MEFGELFNLYQKQYYHEIEVRDKINSRMQIPLAVLVAVLGFLGFMLQNRSPEVQGAVVAVFWAFYISASISVTLAIVFFRKSWFGHTDKLLPTAKQSEAYRKELVELYAEFENEDELVNAAMRQYLYDYYVEFSSINTVNNDSRSYNLYKMTVALTVATVCAFGAYIPYQLNGFDKGNHTKPVQVEVINLPRKEAL